MRSQQTYVSNQPNTCYLALTSVAEEYVWMQIKKLKWEAWRVLKWSHLLDHAFVFVY